MTACAGELVLAEDAPARHEAHPRDEPGERRDREQYQDCAERPVLGEGAVERQRAPVASWKHAGDGEQRSHPTGEQPDEEPAAKASQGRPERHAAAEQSRSEIDRRERGRQQGDEEDELDREASDRAVRRSTRYESVPRATSAAPSSDWIERLRRIVRAGRASRRRCVDRVGARVGRPVACRRERERGDALAEERALVVEVERECEVKELVGSVRAPRALPGLGRDARIGGCEQNRRGRTRRVAAQLDPRRPATREGVQVDDCQDAAR